MLVIYDKATGQISQAVHSGAFDLLKAHYEGAGQGCLMSSESVDLALFYVVDETITPRPTLAIVAPVTEVPADGKTEIQIQITPAAALIEITMQGQTIAVEHVTDGNIQFSATHPGDYTISMTPEFPFLRATMNIKAA